jgi:choline dehydrogenase-like flavoprotein
MSTDVLVVGAGPAGSAAAAWAARSGADVLLADAAIFPRDKTCGDGLTPRAIGELDRLGGRRTEDVQVAERVLVPQHPVLPRPRLAHPQHEARSHQCRHVVRLARRVRHDEVHVDDRLRRKTDHGRRPDMLDLQRPPPERPTDQRGEPLEVTRPPVVVRHQGDAGLRSRPVHPRIRARRRRRRSEVRDLRGQRHQVMLTGHLGAFGAGRHTVSGASGPAVGVIKTEPQPSWPRPDADGGARS